MGLKGVVSVDNQIQCGILRIDMLSPHMAFEFDVRIFRPDKGKDLVEGLICCHAEQVGLFPLQPEPDKSDG